MEIIFIAGIWMLFGPKAIIFLLLSFFFFRGVASAWSQVDTGTLSLHMSEQETHIYYCVEQGGFLM